MAATTCLIAARLGLDAPLTDTLRQAAPLHDIGKIAVPDRILLKRGTLGPRERRRVQDHVRAGADILDGSRSKLLRLAREIVSHQEWWNGKGYPAGLAGESIPLSGRIVALADVFDALTHERPYKPAWPVAAAIAEIDRLSGTQFDPRVVEAFHAAGAGALTG